MSFGRDVGPMSVGPLGVARLRLADVHPGEPLALGIALLAVQVSSTADFGTVVGQTLGVLVALGIVAAFLVVVGLGSILRFAVAVLIAVAILVSATRGGDRIHLVAPLVLLSSIGLLVASRRSSVRAGPMLLGVLGVALLSVALGGLVLRPRNPGGGEGIRERGPANASAQGLLQRIREFLGLDDPAGSSSVDSPEPLPSPNPSSDSLNPWLMLIVVLIALIVAVVVWGFVRRRRSSRRGGVFGAKSELIARFERVGSSAGRERDPSEGLLDYGASFAQPADARPRDAGVAISGALYDSLDGTPAAAEKLVRDLETNPPAGPEDRLKPDQ